MMRVRTWLVLVPGRAVGVRAIADSAAPWSWSVQLPGDPALVGGVLALQSWHASRGGPAGLASSPGLRAVLDLR